MVLDDNDDVADAADVVVRLLVVRRAADGCGGGVHDLEEVGKRGRVVGWGGGVAKERMNC